MDLPVMGVEVVLERSVRLAFGSVVVTGYKSPAAQRVCRLRLEFALSGDKRAKRAKLVEGWSIVEPGRP